MRTLTGAPKSWTWLWPSTWPRVWGTPTATTRPALSGADGTTLTGSGKATLEADDG